MQVMNKDTWNSLPPDLQEIVQEVSDEYARKYGALRTDYTEQGLQYGIEEHGLETIDLGPEEEEKWLSKIQPVVENWIQEKEENGLPGKEAVEIVKELDAKYSEECSK
jgi:TRAP-type C4-dicarboxylate transport system substrate-binding protein